VQQHWKGVGSYATVGLEFTLSIALGMFIGRWLDGRFETKPWLTMIGFAYGLAAGGRAIYRALKRANREADELERKEREERKKFDEEHEPKP
jgi:ATP synthase protein I